MPELRMEAIVKRFGALTANDHIDFDVAKGEIHGLLGENGAGKTTLMNILYGIYHADAGRIALDGEEARIDSPRTAIAHGIGMVHQHFMLVPTLTVVENLMLGQPGGRGAFLDHHSAAGRILELADRYGFRIDPRSKVWQLSVGEQQRVEIIKALYHGAELLILDEPTAVLTPQETEELFVILRELAAQGRSVILISHKLEEIMAVTDRVTILRDGRRVGSHPTSETSVEEMAREMVGREVLFRLHREEKPPGDMILEVTNLHALDDRGSSALQGIDLRLHEGEIVGLAGVDGNGQKELAEVLAGVRRAERGSVILAGRDVVNQRPRDILNAGMYQVPADRHAVGLIMDFDVMRNFILKTYHRSPFSRAGWFDRGRVSEHAESLMKDYDVRGGGPNRVVRLFSGGNQQKMVLARELHHEPTVLVAAQPTRGLDVGATEYIRGKLLEQRSRGAAILLISTELEEILSLSDRILALYEGQIMGELTGGEVDLERLGLLMAGVRGASAGKAT